MMTSTSSIPFLFPNHPCQSFNHLPRLSHAPRPQSRRHQSDPVASYMMMTTPSPILIDGRKKKGGMRFGVRSDGEQPELGDGRETPSRTPTQSRLQPQSFQSITSLSPNTPSSTSTEKERIERGRNRKIVPLTKTLKVDGKFKCPMTVTSSSIKRTINILPPIETTLKMVDQTIREKRVLLPSSQNNSPPITTTRTIQSESPPVPGQIIIGPPVLGLGLAYKTAKEKEGNNDVRLSRMLEMGVDMEGHVGGKGVSGTIVDNVGIETDMNIGAESRTEDASVGGLGTTLPQGNIRDRGERTPHRGRSPARSPITKISIPRLTRTDILRRKSGRIASPRGSHIEPSYLSRSADSRISNISVNGITDTMVLESDGEKTPRVESFRFQQQQQQQQRRGGGGGGGGGGGKGTAEVEEALGQELDLLKMDDIQSTLGRLVGRMARDNESRTEWRGTLRIETPSKVVKETLKVPTTYPYPDKGKARSLSLSIVGPNSGFSFPSLCSQASKSIPSVARQNTKATVSAADIFTNLNDSYISEPNVPLQPQHDAIISRRPRSASLALRRIQDDDLSQLRSIWSAPMDEQHSSGSRLPSNGLPSDAVKDGEVKRSALESGLAKLGLGWASKSSSIENRPVETTRVPSTPDLAGVKSSSSSGVSSGLPTPNFDPVDDWSYTRWDGKRMPITPDHRVHWEFLNNKRRTSYGPSRVKGGLQDAGRRASDTKVGSSTGPCRTLIESPAGGPARYVEITEFDLADEDFAIPVSGHRRSSVRINSFNSTYLPREHPVPSPPVCSSSNKVRRPLYKTSYTTLGLGTSNKRPSYPSSRSTPPPPVSFGSQMAVAISHSRSQGTPARPPRSASGTTLYTPSSPSESASLSTSFDSRTAYEACKGEEGYVSFDRVMRRGEDD